MRGERIVYWGHVRDVPPATIAALIAEHVDHALARATEGWMRDWAVFNGMEDGLAAAARGDAPKDGDARLPASVAGIAKLVVQESSGGGSRRVFPTVRALEIAGLVELEPDDDYVLSMVAGLGTSPYAARGPVEVPALRWVADDPDLFERAIWRVFDVEGGGEVSLTNVDRFGGQWRSCFLTWADSGVIDRGRLLDACLRTMSLDFSSYRVQWYRDLFIGLAPSAAELSCRQAALRRLLASEVAATVGYAVKALSRMLQAGTLDGPATAAALTPAVHSRVKGTAVAAVRLLSAIGQTHPSVDVVGPALEALTHDHVDVQRAAARLLGAAAPELLARNASGIAPSLRCELGLHVPAPVVASLAELTPTGGSTPNPAALTTVGDDLLERLAALLEEPDDAIELELVLDALARSGDGDALRPLRARADALVKRGPGDWDGTHPLNLVLASLVIAATGGKPSQRTPGLPQPAFLHRRMEHVESVLKGDRRPGALLATPDDRRGFVSAEALVARVARTPDLTAPDLVAAVLRLAPEGRELALASLEAAPIGGELRSVLEHSLGADTRLPRASVWTKPWWVAASRARDPLGEDPQLVQARLADPGQGLPLRTSLKVGSRGRRGEAEWQVTVGPSARRTWTGVRSSPDVLMPTCVPERPAMSTWRADVLGAWHRWTALIWPHDAEHFMTQAILAVIGGASAPSGTRWTDTADVLDALARHPGRLGELSYAAIAAGLTHGPAEDRLLAGDVVVDLALARRLDPLALANGMVAVSEVATLTRWSDALGRVASAGQGDMTISVLTRLLPQLDQSTRGLYALLALLHEESVTRGLPVTDPTLVTWLQKLSGGSKAAASASGLLRL